MRPVFFRRPFYNEEEEQEAKTPFKAQILINSSNKFVWKLHFIESSNGTFFTIVFWGDLSTIIVSIASYMLSCFLVFMRNNKQLKQCNI